MRSIRTVAAGSAAVLAGFMMLGTPGTATATGGNNGTVKVAPYGDVDAIPNNTPHVGCVFQLEWYGFDSGVVSHVSFAEQAPTTGVGMAVSGPLDVQLDNDPGKGAGNDGFDGSATYTLSFTGAPHPQQGYHVKLTIDTPESNGASVKHKVFWVEGCAPATSTPTPTPTPTETVTPTPTPTETVTPTPVPTETVVPAPTEIVTPSPSAPVPPVTTPTLAATEISTTQATAAPDAGNNGDGEIEVLGAQASAGTNVAGQQSGQQSSQQSSQTTVAGEQQAVPTAINAGVSASDTASGASVPVALTILAALLALLALVAHRRGARTARDLV